MGNQVDKKVVDPRLTAAEISKLLARFNLNTVDAEGVEFRDVQELWKSELVPSLLRLLLKNLFPGDESFCPLAKFIALFVHVVRGDYEEKASVLSKIISNNPDAKDVQLKFLKQYLEDLLESHVKGITCRDTRAFSSWNSNISQNKREYSLVINHWCESLNEIPQIPLNKFQTWLTNCGIVNALHVEKFGVLYGLQQGDDFDIGLLPLLTNPEDMEDNSTPLTISYLIHLNNLIPQDNQEEWRLLFSTDIHGESFATMLSKIIDQGPTIIVVMDEKKRLFGGFASSSWTLNPKFQGNSRCFLFTLAPTVEVYFASGMNENYMYLNNYQQSLPNGLGMGGRFDFWGFWLDASFGTGMCADMCTTFKDYKRLSDKKNFKIKFVEVWGVGPPPLTAAQKGERTGILNSDPTATTILEMAGKSQHSTHLRSE